MFTPCQHQIYFCPDPCATRQVCSVTFGVTAQLLSFLVDPGWRRNSPQDTVAPSTVYLSYESVNMTLGVVHDKSLSPARREPTAGAKPWCDQWTLTTIENVLCFIRSQLKLANSSVAK